MTGSADARLKRHDRRIVLGVTSAIVLLSWAVLTIESSGSGMHGQPALSWLVTFAMWHLMMVAMMLPPALPWILLFSGAGRVRGAMTEPYLSTAAFVAGYMQVWALFAAVAATLQAAMQSFMPLMAEPPQMSPATPIAAIGLDL